MERKNTLENQILEEIHETFISIEKCIENSSKKQLEIIDNKKIKSNIKQHMTKIIEMKKKRLKCLDEISYEIEKGKKIIFKINFLRN